MFDLIADGFVVFDADPRVTRWATRAHVIAGDVTSDPAQQAQWLRHGKTWFVGVDALPNEADGSVDDAPLSGPWEGQITPPTAWHRAQISVTYPNFPLQDADESDSAHRFRTNRCGAHVDGLHLEAGRRIVREPHSFILGLPLNTATACPLVIWKGSHAIMQAALAGAIEGQNPVGADVTDIYKATRARIFETCEKVEVEMGVGQSVLLDRLALHGVAPWNGTSQCPPEGRMVAYFRPQFEDAKDWLGR